MFYIYRFLHNKISIFWLRYLALLIGGGKKVNEKIFPFFRWKLNLLKIFLNAFLYNFNFFFWQIFWQIFLTDFLTDFFFWQNFSDRFLSLLEGRDGLGVYFAIEILNILNLWLYVSVLFTSQSNNSTTFRSSVFKY